MLTSSKHIQKVDKTINLLCKLPTNLSRALLVTICELFIRLHLHYGNILFDQMFNNSFDERLGSIDYNESLAITGAIRVISREKLYQELGFKSLREQRQYRKLSLFFKVIKRPISQSSL